MTISFECFCVTALTFFAFWERLDTIPVLLKQKKKNMSNKYGLTPILTAKKLNRKTIKMGCLPPGNSYMFMVMQ